MLTRDKNAYCVQRLVYKNCSVDEECLQTFVKPFPDKKKIKNNKCVITDTNPAFAFDIAFLRAQVSQGFYKGYRNG